MVRIMRTNLFFLFQIFIFIGSSNFLYSAYKEPSVDDDIDDSLELLSESFEALKLNLKKLEAVDKKFSNLNKELAQAIRNGGVSEVKELLKLGAQMTEVRTPKTGNSALHLAVLSEDGKVFEKIETAFKNGAKSDAKGKDGRTFLYTFISLYTEQSFADFAACVWLYDVDLTVVDKNGYTLFHAAAEAGRLDWIVFLLGLFECKFESENRLVDLLNLLQKENKMGESVIAVAKRRKSLYESSMHDFEQAEKFNKIIKVLEMHIKSIQTKWLNSKESLGNSLSLDKKQKAKIKKKMRRSLSDVYEH